MKKIITLCILLFCVSFTASCGKKDETVDVVSQTDDAGATPEPTPKPTPSPEPTEDLSGKAINALTGLYIDKDAALRRPVAVVINNLHKAKPQSGIAQADIIYEVLAEGDITRLVAFFRDFASAKIGPVRSARDYFLDFAADNDAIFVHHGGSPQAYSDIKKLKVNDVDGMKDAASFWRDPERFKIASMYEHSSYTNAEHILDNLPAKNFRLEITEGALEPFKFHPLPRSPENSVKATKLTVPYSSSYTRIFEYDDTAKKYKVFQGKNSHIDEETGEQLAVTNVIVQFVKMRVISGDDAGRRDVSLIGSGDGFLFTNGTYEPITWSKEAYDKPTVWLDAHGDKIRINMGKTWINVFSGNVTMDVNVEE